MSLSKDVSILISYLTVPTILRAGNLLRSEALWYVYLKQESEIEPLLQTEKNKDLGIK